jgi:hypothetical protein
MTEQEQVQVTQADRDAAEALRGSPAYALGFYDHTPLVQAFARHRHTATAEALELLKRARDREHNPFEPDNQTKLYHDLTAAIAKIEGEQP